MRLAPRTLFVSALLLVSVAFFSCVGNSDTSFVASLSYVEVRSAHPSIVTTPGFLTLWWALTPPPQGFCITYIFKPRCYPATFSQILSSPYTLHPPDPTSRSATPNWSELEVLRSLPQTVNPLAFLTTLLSLPLLALTFLSAAVAATSSQPSSSVRTVAATTTATLAGLAATALLVAFVCTTAFGATVSSQIAAAYAPIRVAASLSPWLPLAQVAGAALLAAAAAAAGWGAVVAKRERAGSAAAAANKDFAATRTVPADPGSALPASSDQSPPLPAKDAETVYPGWAYPTAEYYTSPLEHAAGTGVPGTAAVPVAVYTRPPHASHYEPVGSSSETTAAAGVGPAL
ncbi:hypothetical protein DFJ73DRAFT_760482 [Zopfochytrium polystomum]|nr:hypothetical protein DFJ73DRAFT_760482 [Zopfochytrium polystomum]